MGNRGYNSYKWSHGPLLISGKGPQTCMRLTEKPRSKPVNVCSLGQTLHEKVPTLFYNFFCLQFHQPKQTFPQKI